MEGRRSVGKARYIRRRSQPKRVNGPLLVMTQTTVGKWWFSLEKPAQNQSAICTALAPAIQSSAKAKQRMIVQ